MGGEIYNTAFEDLNVKANGFHYEAVYDSTTLKSLIMLYLHYGKQFVKTVLSAPPSGDAGQRLSCVLRAAVYRDISLLDAFAIGSTSRIHEETWRVQRETLALSRVAIADDIVIKSLDCDLLHTIPLRCPS